LPREQEVELCQKVFLPDNPEILIVVLLR